MSASQLKKLIKNYPDFPQPGIQFKDISSILADPSAFQSAIDLMAEQVQKLDFDYVVGIDARGFIFASALAFHLHKGLIMSRKSAKLPGDLVVEAYDYEYSTAELTLQKERLQPGKKYLIADDVLATGNTMNAVCQMINRSEGSLSGAVFFIELDFLKGRELLTTKACLNNTQIKSVLHI